MRTVRILAAGSRRGRRAVRGLEGVCCTAPRKDAEVVVEATDELKKWREARVVKHSPSVATHGKDAIPIDGVVSVEDEAVLFAQGAAAVDDRLTVVLAEGLQLVERKQPIGSRVKLRLADRRLQRRVENLQGPARQQPWVCEPGRLRHAHEVVPIERAAETLAVEDGVIAHGVGQTAMRSPVVIAFANRSARFRSRSSRVGS